MASTLPELRKELMSYTIKQELIDETNCEKVGIGAYGFVTKAKYCGTPCALKELHLYLLPESGAELRGKSSYIVEKFCAEIKLLSEIRHPNFVHFIGVYFRENSSFPVLVMELMHTSVTECLKQYEGDKLKFPLSTKLFILQDVARALVYLHSQNPPIIHRDLTANNVLLTSDMRAKLADLGVAKIINLNLVKPPDTRCPGTLAYMPPEALKEHPKYSTELDVYSLGVLGFHIFSGKWPHPHGIRKDDNSLLSDTERCRADLIGEGLCLLKTLENCLDINPLSRLTAPNILAIIEGVITDHRLEECNFLEAQYTMTNHAAIMDEMNKHIASLSHKLTYKEGDISRLENTEKVNTSTIERLKCDSKDLKSTVKLLEEKNASQALKLKKLHEVAELQEETIARSLNTVFNEKFSLPCQHCFSLEKESKNMSDCNISLQEKIDILLSETKLKDQEIINKKNELELKDEEIKILNEKIKLLEAKADFTLKRTIDIVSAKELSERNAKLLETIEMLREQLVEKNDRLKIGQDHYRKIIQDLLIPHKGIVCSNLQCMEFTWKDVASVKLKPADQFTSVVQSFKKNPGSSILEKLTPIVNQDGIIFFLCDVYLKKNKKLCPGIALYFDWNMGDFNMVGDLEVEFVTIGHFGSKILGLKTSKQFCLLDNLTWKETSIPPLPLDDIRNPVILTYQSLLLVIDGSAVFVHDDSVYSWLQFELLTLDGKLDCSPKNSFAVVGGKLFVCDASKEMVFCVELQTVIQNVFNRSATLEAENSAVSNPVLQLSYALKGANFISLHGTYVLALHTTSTTRVSSVYIDRIRYYDINCCHWHEVECNGDTTNIVRGCWLSLFDDDAGVVLLPTLPVWSSWQSWGSAYLYKIQLKKN